MVRVWIKFVFGTGLISECLFYFLCYPYGPPLSVCDNGLPAHIGNNSVTNPPQTTPCPFQINVNVTSYSPGDVISVKVSSDVGEMYKGLFLQMREVPNFEGQKINRHPVGSFSRKLANTKLSACDIGLDTAFHKDPFFKMTAELNWKAPLLMENDVIVRATILMDFSTYWTNVESRRIKLIRPDRLPAEDLERPWVDELIKTVKADDKKNSRRLVKERFKKGFEGVMDPRGYIMVQYINDILPFQESHYGVNNTKNNIVAVINSTVEESGKHEKKRGKYNQTSEETPNTNTTSTSIEQRKNATEMTKLENTTASERGVSSDNLQNLVSKTCTNKDNLQDVSNNNTIATKNTERIRKETYVKLLGSVLNGDKDAAFLLEEFLDKN